jgi:hypothetical protein
MALVEIFFIWCLFPAGLICIPTLCFILISSFDGFPRLKIQQIGSLIACIAWGLGLTTQGGIGEAYAYVSCCVFILIFLASWRHEFCELMLKHDHEFSTRWDKIGWFLMLTIGAPVGVWCFRRYRQLRWPVESPAERLNADSPPPKTSQSPWDRDDLERSPYQSSVG